MAVRGSASARSTACSTTCVRFEVTHGANGWHPHLHILFFLEVRLTAEEQDEARAWLEARWARCVRRALGADFVPNEHGVDESRRADYLAKFSFELTDPGTKRARGKNRTPLQIAVAAADSDADAALWVSYCEGMRGAKMLTWSRGLREFVGLDAERTDEVVVATEDAPEAEPVAVISSGAWDAIRHKRGMLCTILETAELVPNSTEAAETIQALIWGAARRKVPP